MSTRPATVPDSISDFVWEGVVSLVAGLPDSALARTVTMTTEQIQTCTTSTGYDAALALLLAAVEEQEGRAAPGEDPARTRLVATARVGALLSEVLMRRQSPRTASLPWSRQ